VVPKPKQQGSAVKPKVNNLRFGKKGEYAREMVSQKPKPKIAQGRQRGVQTGRGFNQCWRKSPQTGTYGPWRKKKKKRRCRQWD